MKLNDQQELAANHKDGPCLVTACPGSGKTRTIVERTARLVVSGVAPQKLLAITFTNKAANEMRERVEKRIGETAKNIFIATFHRLSSTILREYGSVFGYSRYMTILDEDEQVDLMLQVARQKGHEFTRPQIKKIVYATNDCREKLEDNFSLADRLDRDDPNFFEVAEEYLKRLPIMNATDFTGLLSETVRLLTTHKDILAKLQARWTHFMVDEVQDTNLSQFKIVELLSCHTKNIFVVGDLDQSIYGWRGARSENISDFCKTYSGTKIVSLGKNYRSTPQIVKVADKLIQHNEGRIAAPFETDNPNGDPVICKAYLDDREEAKQVAMGIAALVKSGRCRYKEVAVFYRMNSMSRAIEMACVQQQLPHTVIGSFSFYDRKEVKDCLAMMRFLANPRDGISFHRIANKPKRSLGDTTIGKIENFATAHNCSLLGACGSMSFSSELVREGLYTLKQAFDWQWENEPLGHVLDHLVKALKYEEYLKEDPDTYLERMENVQELINDATRYSAESGNDLAGYLEQMALMSGSDKSADGDSISLMSLHASKGLEFPVVFMLGVEQNILPHKRAVDERADGLDEERRLCYVGMTRAEKLLFVTYCNRRQDNNASRRGSLGYRQSIPSQFLIEAGLLQNLKEVTVRKRYDGYQD